ncbi:MAG: fimbrial protein [Chania sp.]
MIKRITPLAILAATLLAPPLWAADGTMKFSGKVKENTCVLMAGSKNQTVNMGRNSTYYMGSISSANELTVQLNDCPASSNQVRVKFEGTPATSESDPGKIFAFSNTGQPGAAGNVGFIIGESYSFSSLIQVNGTSKLYDLQTGPGSINKLPFYVGYEALTPGVSGAGIITPGTVIGNVQFSVLYP